MHVEEPMLAAECFLALVQGQQQFIAGCGDGMRDTPARRTQNVKAAVEVFLRIYPIRA